jgi:hypothetical protein
MSFFWITATWTQEQNAAIDCDEFQIAVLMNRVEYKKKRNYEVSLMKYHLIFCLSLFLITSLKLSPWFAIHSCCSDRQLTLTSQT